MAGDLGLLSLTQLPKLAHQHPNPNPGSWAWNARRTASNDNDDSWEVRAFAEDAGNIMGTTWPPRSYTCTFCRREFRSAQALGGHMNVHRRDRARLHHAPPTVSEPSSTTTATTTTTSTPLIFPTQEFITSGGLCLFYPFPPHGSMYTPTSANGCLDSPSTLLSIAPYSSNNAISPTSPSCTFPGIFDSSICHSRKGETKVPVYSSNNDNNTSNRNEDGDDDNDNHKEPPMIEDLDLELRLGRSPPRH